MAKELYRCDRVKDFEMGRLLYLSGSDVITRVLIREREAEEKERWRQKAEIREER